MAGAVALVLAAGQGKRMRSRLPKVLHPVGGRPMLLHVMAAVKDAGMDRVAVVVGPGSAQIRQVLGAAGQTASAGVECVVQAAPRGTGDAVLSARAWTGPADDVLVVYGDTPLLTSGLLRDLLAEHRRRGAAATLLTATLDQPFGYGRILRDGAGRVRAIIEQADCTPEQAQVREVNTGIGCWRGEVLWGTLDRVRPNNAQGEIYLTDAVGILCRDGLPVEAVPAADPRAVLGVNDRRALAEAEGILRERTLDRLMASGVTVIDPATTYVDAGAEIGPDSVLCPLTVIEGPCRIGEGCRIGPGAHLRESRLGDRVTVLYSFVESSDLGDGCTVGPYSHLRPGTRLAPDVHVGNFAEIKNSVVGSGSKVPHHSYLGDADVGTGVNVGAGTVTVNYDGEGKHRTRVGDGAFLGCNTNLIAPVGVGDGAFVAAGSTVTEDVPPDALGIARARQVNKPGWAERRRRAAGRSAEGAAAPSAEPSGDSER